MTPPRVRFIQAGTDYLKTPILVTYDVSKDVYTPTKVDADDTAGYDTYVTVTGDSVKVDGSVTGTSLPAMAR